MKYEYLVRGNSNELLIFFTGWSRDANPARRLIVPDNCDVVVVYDYTKVDELDIDWNFYSKKVLIAWSLGVWAAAEYFTAHPQEFKHALAINGTLYPIDAEKGIAPEVFAGTIANWGNERARQKFALRMAGRGVTLPEVARTWESQQQELQAIQARYLSRSTPVVNCFQSAVIGKLDRIFPATAQKAAWQELGITPAERDLPHYFARDITAWSELQAWETSPLDSVRRRFARHLSTYEKNAPVQANMALELTHNLCRLTEQTQFDRVLEIGCGSGGLTRLMTGTIAYQEYVANDLVPECGSHLTDFPRLTFCPGNAEIHDFGGNFDLIVSNAALQWFLDLPGVPRYLAQRLKRHGCCAITGFGPDNLHEISDLSGQGLAYWSLSEWKTRFEEYFEILWLQEKKFCIGFASPREMLKQLKLSGVTASGSRTRWTKQRLAEFEEQYQQKFGICDGRVELTWHPIFLIARKKDE